MDALLESLQYPFTVVCHALPEKSTVHVCLNHMPSSNMYTEFYSYEVQAKSCEAVLDEYMNRGFTYVGKTELRYGKEVLYEYTFPEPYLPEVPVYITVQEETKRRRCV